jgi:lysine 2,3-aminomutase
VGAPAPQSATLDDVTARYPLAITPQMRRLINPADPADPIARQFLPDLRELDQYTEELADPIDDAGFSPVPGLVHRYEDRVLLKVISACPVYCRFCFRREMVGQGEPGLTGEALATALAYIGARPAIREVILTGGDPFLLSARRAGELTDALAAIPHVELVRWHTRVPMVEPDRVSASFVRALRAAGIATFVAVHANHPREFAPEAEAALARLADAGIALVSQSVLLRGVNDEIGTLSALMRAFLCNRVKPYYLHHPDLAPGTEHFRLPVARGLELMEQLRQTVTGLGQPTYVLDVPGGAFKAPLAPSYLREDPDSGTLVRGADRWHPLSPAQQGLAVR